MPSIKKSSQIKQKVKVMKLLPCAELPEYAMPGDLGFDFRACESVTLGPFEQKEVRTGIALEIPEGYLGLIRDRAGMVTEMAVHVVAGTYCPSYRGEVGIMMINFGEESVRIEKGMRIAQMIIVPAAHLSIEEVKSLSPTARGHRTQGSTGFHEIKK
jgi:dUTP pyrophosphatase